jgi:hypothetical protein
LNPYVLSPFTQKRAAADWVRFRPIAVDDEVFQTDVCRRAHDEQTPLVPKIRVRRRAPAHPSGAATHEGGASGAQRAEGERLGHDDLVIQDVFPDWNLDS